MPSNGRPLEEEAICTLTDMANEIDILLKQL
jgi:hypothetical protein